MAAKLISITPNAEKVIAFCARASSDYQDNPEYARLFKYLVAHQHHSPLEMAHAVLEIETSRAVAAQILRHRSFSFQELSQRYTDAPADVELLMARRQATKNRQSSTDDLDEQTKNWFLCAQADVANKAQTLYQAAIIRGVSREQARMLLPLGTKTKLYMSGTIRSWVHYCQLRCAADTQQEHRRVAEECRTLLAKELPILAEALSWTT